MFYVKLLRKENEIFMEKIIEQITEQTEKALDDFLLEYTSYSKLSHEEKMLGWEIAKKIRIELKDSTKEMDEEISTILENTQIEYQLKDLVKLKEIKNKYATNHIIRNKYDKLVEIIKK